MRRRCRLTDISGMPGVERGGTLERRRIEARGGERVVVEVDDGGGDVLTVAKPWLKLRAA